MRSRRRLVKSVAVAQAYWPLQFATGAKDELLKYGSSRPLGRQLNECHLILASHLSGGLIDTAASQRLCSLQSRSRERPMYHGSSRKCQRLARCPKWKMDVGRIDTPSIEQLNLSTEHQAFRALG